MKRLLSNKKRWLPPVLILVFLFVILVFLGRGEMTETSIYSVFGSK